MLESSFQPYYEKVHEYTNSESRDLWEYTLDFSPQETLSLVNHLWELESNSWFDYYFINKNCSYQLLTALEAIKPDWDLSSGWFFVVPAETVKRVLTVPGAVTRVRYRPSLRHKMGESLNLLSLEEKEVFEKLIRRKIQPKEVDSRNVISVAIAYVQYHRAETEGTFDGELREFWNELLTRRNELASQTDPLTPQKDLISNRVTAYEDLPPDPPEIGHGPVRIGLSQGFYQRSDTGIVNGFQEFHIKPAYHDLLNDDRGYLPFSEINFPNLTLRYYPQTGTLNLEQLQFVGMVSIPPFSFLEKRLSWKIDVELSTPKDLLCTDCHVLHTEMGAGATLNLFSPKSLIYGLGGAYVDFGSGLGRFYRLGPGFEVGILANPWAPYKIRLRSLTSLDVFQSERPLTFETIEVSQSLSWIPHWEMRLNGIGTSSLGTHINQAPIYYEGKLSLNYYF